MLNVNDNKITLTRGDSLTLTVEITKDGEPYEIQPGDAIRFAMSVGYEGEPGYSLVLEKNIPTNTLEFTLSAQETKIDGRRYNYDIEITHSDGTVDTFISSTIEIIGEVK